MEQEVQQNCCSAPEDTEFHMRSSETESSNAISTRILVNRTLDCGGDNPHYRGDRDPEPLAGQDLRQRILGCGFAARNDIGRNGVLYGVSDSGICQSDE